MWFARMMKRLKCGIDCGVPNSNRSCTRSAIGAIGSAAKRSTPRGRQKYLQEGMIPFGLTHFFFESCHVFAQRVDNALVSLFSLARALQLSRIKRLSEGDPHFPETRQDSADWQGLVCSRDEHRYDRDRETRKHDTDY